MRIELDNSGVALIREQGDRRIGKESTIVFHLRNLLNERDGRTGATRGTGETGATRGDPRQGYAGDGRAGTWRRFYPCKVGLTGSRLGVWNGRQGRGQVAYWHERYAVEDAAEEFNKQGRVWFQRAAAGE